MVMIGDKYVAADQRIRTYLDMGHSRYMRVPADTHVLPNNDAWAKFLITVAFKRFQPESFGNAEIAAYFHVGKTSQPAARTQTNTVRPKLAGQYPPPNEHPNVLP